MTLFRLVAASILVVLVTGLVVLPLSQPAQAIEITLTATPFFDGPDPDPDPEPDPEPAPAPANPEPGGVLLATVLRVVVAVAIVVTVFMNLNAITAIIGVVAFILIDALIRALVR